MSEKEKSPSPLINEQTAEAITRELETLALVRTKFASERSLMAWMRTSVSLFTFGFSITKFIDYLEKQQVGTQFSGGIYRLGFALVCLGILALVLAMLEHVHRLRTMQEQGLQRARQYLLPLGSSVVLLAIGIAAVLSVYFNWSL